MLGWWQVGHLGIDGTALLGVDTGGVLRGAGRTLREWLGAVLAFAGAPGMGGRLRVCVLFDHGSSPYLRLTS